MPSAIGLLLLFSLGFGTGLRAFLCSPPLRAVGLGIYQRQQLFTAPTEYFAGPGEVIAFLLPVLCLTVPISYILIEQPAIKIRQVSVGTSKTARRGACLNSLD